MIDRAICEAVFREAVVACNPALRVREALAVEPLHGTATIGLAIGKAAIAMARGAGPVARGLVVAPQPRTSTSLRPAAPPAPVVAPAAPLPPGWSIRYAAHPMPDETSFAAGAAAIQIVDSAAADDVVLALVSGGASALVEQPRPGLGVDEYREQVRGVMASGAPIAELNRVRTELSAIKGGKLATRSKAPIVTLVVSDVIGDDPRVIGSGPTVTDPSRPGDRVEVVAPMVSFGLAVADALAARGLAVRRIAEPIADDVVAVAQRLAVGAGAVADREAAEHGAVAGHDAAEQGAVVAREAAEHGAVADREAAEHGAVADREVAEQGAVADREAAGQGAVADREAAEEGAVADREATGQGAVAGHAAPKHGAVAGRAAPKQGAAADHAPAEHGVLVAWGEPTVRVPETHGVGGRAQQLALELARLLRGTSRSAFVAGSDGRDGPTDAAGAYVDGTTWDALVARAASDPRLDPDAALRRCDAGTVLAAVGALVVTGPTGINHADVVILG